MGILGVIVGILGLLLSLLLFWIQKIRKYPSQLSYSVLACSRIVGKNELEFNDGVSLNYKDYEVKDDLYYTKILVFNKRSSDVIATEKDSLIALELPKDSKWLDIRVNKESLNVGSKVGILPGANQIASLSFNLLKKEEYIVFDGIIESKTSLVDDINSFLSINHRIAELDTFECVPVVTEARYKRCRKFLKGYGTVIGLMALLLVGSLFLPERSPVLYRNINDSTEAIKYSVTIDKKDRVVVNRYKAISLGVDPGQVVSNSEFESNFYPELHFHRSFRFYYNIVMSLLLVVFYCMLSLDFIKDIYRYKMVHKYVKEQRIEKKG